MDNLIVNIILIIVSVIAGTYALIIYFKKKNYYILGIATCLLMTTFLEIQRVERGYYSELAKMDTLRTLKDIIRAILIMHFLTLLTKKKK